MHTRKHTGDIVSWHDIQPTPLLLWRLRLTTWYLSGSVGQIGNQLPNCRRIQSAGIKTTRYDESITNWCPFQMCTQSYSHSKFRMSHGVKESVNHNRCVSSWKGELQGGNRFAMLEWFRTIKGEEIFFFFLSLYLGDFWQYFIEQLVVTHWRLFSHTCQRWQWNHQSAFFGSLELFL